MANVAQQIRRRQNRRLNMMIEGDEDPTEELKSKTGSATEKERVRKIEQIQKLKKTLKINDTIAAILAAVGLILAIYEYEDYYENFENNEEYHFRLSSIDNPLRAIVTVTTVCLVGFLIRHNLISYKVYIIKYPLLAPSKFTDSKFLYYMIIEIFICAVHVPPGLNWTFVWSQLGQNVTYSISTILINWMLIRSYLILRLFAEYSKWTSRTAEECCEPEGCEANTMFAIKAVLKDKPYTTLAIIMVSSTIVFGLAVRNFERPYYYGWPNNETGFQDYSYIWNGMWLIAVTMTTGTYESIILNFIVGYGDFFARTHLGRLVSVIACFWGVFLVSMMVVTLTVSSNLETKEQKAYEILSRITAKKALRGDAQKVVALTFKVYVLKKKYLKNKISVHDYEQIRHALMGRLIVRKQEFADMKAKIGDYEVAPEELLRQLTEKVDRDFQEIKEILMSLVTLEQQLHQIEDSQNAVMSALTQCMGFTNTLQEELLKFRSTFQGQQSNFFVFLLTNCFN